MRFTSPLVPGAPVADYAAMHKQLLWCLEYVSAERFAADVQVKRVHKHWSDE